MIALDAQVTVRVEVNLEAAQICGRGSCYTPPLEIKQAVMRRADKVIVAAAGETAQMRTGRVERVEADLIAQQPCAGADNQPRDAITVFGWRAQLLDDEERHSRDLRGVRRIRVIRLGQFSDQFAAAQ